MTTTLQDLHALFVQYGAAQCILDNVQDEYAWEVQQVLDLDAGVELAYQLKVEWTDATE